MLITPTNSILLIYPQRLPLSRQPSPRSLASPRLADRVPALRCVAAMYSFKELDIPRPTYAFPPPPILPKKILLLAQRVEEGDIAGIAKIRSLYEGALKQCDNHDECRRLLVGFADFEERLNQFDRAKQVMERAVQLYPDVSLFWRQYIHLEKMLGNVAGVRQIYESWIKVDDPREQAWTFYITFEIMNDETDLARQIFEQFVKNYPNVGAWIRYAKFEMSNCEVAKARNVFQRVVHALEEAEHPNDYDEKATEQLLVAFAKFEVSRTETERAWCIYKYAVDQLPKARAEAFYSKLLDFEKQYAM